MRLSSDRQSFRNEELALKVSTAVDRKRWDESRYEAFIDELCGDREYQKEAIRTTLRYLLGGEYSNLRALAEKNFENNPVLRERYGSWSGMQRHLQLPNQLAASLDLATGTGKSYVLYGLAVIMLAEGIVDRVLVLCPSTTIESGLLEKFRGLSASAELRALLPAESRIATPHVINASESITEGSLCVENYHAVLEHVGSSIRDSLSGKGTHTLILNDEAHHVANEPTANIGRWKEFLTDTTFGFRFVIGVSGTCYVKNEYFADVIYRYSLRQAMEQRYVKRVDYVAEMPSTGAANEKWQLIRNRHEAIKHRLKNRDILPLTIIVTPTVARCKDIAEELKAFLKESAGITSEEITKKILVVYNGAPDVSKLRYVDQSTNDVEWIVSVSMLNEGWDVKRVFQIVPHEERAFNSKLLIAQVLGRGLRVPLGWIGAQPEVVIFNHDSWATNIKHLVNEILERDKRLTSQVLPDSPHHFELHNIDYTLEPVTIKKPMDGHYRLFEKGYVELPADIAEEEVKVEFERATTGDRYTWQTTIRHKVFTPIEMAAAMFERLEDAYDPEDPDPNLHYRYTDDFPLEKLEEIVRTSLLRRGMTVATENVRQKFLQALGTLRRTESLNVRYNPKADRFYTLSTKSRPSESVGIAELRRDKTYFYMTERTRGTLDEEQLESFDEVAELASGYKCFGVTNHHDFKTALNAAIADSDPEKRFIQNLIDPINASHYEAWIKSTATRFYEIDYAWKKGQHAKRGKFSPDFFIKSENLILIIEIKHDDESREPSEENRKKNEYALLHTERLNGHLKEVGSSLRYQFNFLTPSNYATFFTWLRMGNVASYKSELDLKLLEES